MNPWFRIAIVLAVFALLLAAWEWTPVRDSADVKQLFARFAPYRQAWFALPVVVLVYIALGLSLVPVLLLIAATGVAFGPWLGPVYAMTGCLASASTGFAIGRWTGLRRMERLGGRRVTKISRALERNGTLAVFLLRKVPAPFMLSNIVAGASKVRYRDFVIGTVLGMGAFVIALAGFGYQLIQTLGDPSVLTVLGAAIFLGVPPTLAWFINRAFRRRHEVLL